MAASAWKVYNEAKKYFMNGTVDLDSSILRMALYKSTSNASTFTLSTAASISNVVNASGYTGVKNLTASVVSVNASTWAFTHASVVFTASGADVTSIMYAVIYQSGGKAIAWSKLSSAVFTVTSGNTLAIIPNANGVFNVSGGTS